MHLLEQESCNFLPRNKKYPTCKQSGMFKMLKRAIVTLSMRLKDKSENKLLLEVKIAKVAIMSRDFFFLESILCLDKH